MCESHSNGAQLYACADKHVGLAITFDLAKTENLSFTSSLK